MSCAATGGKCCAFSTSTATACRTSLAAAPRWPPAPAQADVRQVTQLVWLAAWHIRTALLARSAGRRPGDAKGPIVERSVDVDLALVEKEEEEEVSEKNKK